MYSALHAGSISLASSLALFAFALSMSTLSGCADAPERPHTEDQARLIAPLPACIMQLSQHAGVGVSLKEEQYWKLVYPAYDSSAHTLPPDSKTCTGGDLATNKDLAGGAPLHAKVEEGDVAFGGGGDRLKVAWLRSVKWGDGTEGGALVLVRAFPSSAELYAVGAFRGRVSKSRFSIERLGSEVVVVVTDDGCKARDAGKSCDATTHVFLPREGELRPVAKFATERVAYLVDSEPGIRGRFEYRMSSAPEYILGGIRLQEQVVVRDDFGREVRKAELNRSFTFGPGDTMVASDESLWSRIVRMPNAKPESGKTADTKEEKASR